MQREWITLLPAFFIAAGAASGQTTQTRIFTEPAGASFFVDGIKYASSATFFWPKGSRHTVWTGLVQYTGDTTRMTFGGWADDKTVLQAAAASTITVTADPDFLSLKATFMVEHRIDILFYNVTADPLPEIPILCSVAGRPGNPVPVPVVPAPTPPVGPPVTPVPPTAPPPQGTPTGPPGVFMVPGPGALYVDGVCVANSLVIWRATNSPITLNAFPARGFVFEGWQVDNVPRTDSFLRTYTVNGPAVLSPRFAPAKRVTIQTEPFGLQVMVDRTLTPTRFPEESEMRYRDSGNVYPIPPWEFDFADGSSHILGAPATQLDLTGKTWILDSFSIGGGEGTIFKASGANIPQVIVAINKMDMVGYSQDAYNNIVIDFAEVASSLGLKNITYIPISALDGDNIVDLSTNFSWYEGESLLHILETVEVEHDVNLTHARFPVQYVIRPQTEGLHNYRGYAGKLVSGIYRKGDKVTVLPSGLQSTIKAIEIGGKEIDEAFAPQSIVLHLADDIDVSRGDLIVPSGNFPQSAQELDLLVCWMGNKPLAEGNRYLLQINSRLVKSIVKQIHYRLDVNSLQQQPSPETVSLNDIVRVTIKTASPVPYDAYNHIRVNGGAILIDETSNVTVGACMIQ